MMKWGRRERGQRPISKYLFASFSPPTGPIPPEPDSPPSSGADSDQGRIAHGGQLAEHPSPNRLFKCFRQIFPAHGSIRAGLSPRAGGPPNRFRFSARIARCIAVIGSTGGVPSWWGWGRVSVRVRAVWRGGLQHAAVTSGWRLASSPNRAVLVRRGQRRLLGRLVIVHAVLTPCVRQGFCWL